MAAAQNGSSIFPLAFPTQVITAEFLQDAYVQLIELINQQCAPFANAIPFGAATFTLAPGNSNGTFLFNAASGSVYTLPGATGSGVKFRFVTTVVLTSNFNKIIPSVAGDFIIGAISTQVAAGTTTGFQSPLATNHSIRINGTTTGSAGVGEWLEIEDVGTNLWRCNGFTFSSGTVATPFNAATT